MNEKLFLKFVKEWIDKANEDFQAASILLEHEVPLTSPVCFHCQQAVEKFLKAYLIYNRIEVEKTHDLKFLKDECVKIDNSFYEINFGDLNQYSVDGRYPGFATLPTIKEAKQYLDIAEEVKELVLSKISLNN